MPLQDAVRPSRKQMLAAERKRHGAYDPVRLEKQLLRRRGFQRRLKRSGLPSGSGLHLWKRDDATAATDSTAASSMNLPPAPPNSGAVPPAPPPGGDDASVPAADPQVNGGDPSPSQSSAPAPVDPGTMHNDTASTTAQNYTLSSTDPSSGTIGDAPPDDGLSQSTVGLVAGGLVCLVLLLVALGVWYKCYRHKFGRGVGSRGKRKDQSHRLGSIDGLKSLSTGTSRNSKSQEAFEDKTGSSDFLVNHHVPPGKAGPFDRAVASMISHAQPTQQPNNTSTAAASVGYLGIPGPTLSHSRSLDSIAEVVEPSSSVSTHFAVAKRDSLATYCDATPQRVTWTDRLHRPTTAPGQTSRSFGSSPASTVYGTPESKMSKKGSNRRPQSAKSGTEIEMTRQGSTLIIRNRPSTATLRRPLSSAGSQFRNVLRKNRGGEEEDDGAICIETDGIVEREDAGVYDLAVPSTSAGTRPLGSHFSNSTLGVPHARASYATIATTSPSGSFSFEIKDAVRLGAPSTLETRPSGASGEDTVGKLRLKESGESFVRDLDWDLHDCHSTDDREPSSSLPQSSQKAQPGNQ